MYEPVSLSKINVIAFDPGETTGIAVLQEGKGIVSHIIGHKNGFIEFNAFLEELECTYGMNGTNTRAVIEEWRLFPRSLSALTFNKNIPARVIGQITSALTVHFFGEVTYQSPSLVKQLFKDDLIKSYLWYPEMKFYKKNPTRHEMDALRHACYYAAFKG